MAAAPAAFSFVFGISETPLTQALERRNYDEALQYIDSRYGVCLDEGYYRRTPLFIVLSRENSSFDGKAMPVHIKIARKLIERGADPNLRIPVSYGAEYVSPGRSPLECVVDYYNHLTNRCKPITVDHIIPKNQAISANHLNTSAQELTEELIDITWMLLGHGADVNIRDAENKTPLHNTLLRSCDLRMAQVLCDNGADTNAVDQFGNTPLMALCSPMPWQGDVDDNQVYGPGMSGYDISMALHYLLRFDHIKINHCGRHGRTALFYAMQSGNISAAKVLLDRGANPSLRGMGPDGRYISPLLAALIPWSSQDRHATNSLANLAPLIDNGYFSTPEILKELIDYALADEANDPLLSKIVYKGVTLVELLFGQSSCHLTQLAARTYLKTIPGHVGKRCASMTSYDVIKLVRAQGLPSELFTYMQIVLLREKILSSLAETDWDEWDLEEFSANDSDDYDESDDEFW